MIYTIQRVESSDELMHFGVKGQKHGIRRYQNEDGSLTVEGKERYGSQTGWEAKQMYKKGTITKDQYKQKRQEAKKSGYSRSDEFYNRHKKGVKVAAGLFAAGLATLAVTQAVKAHNIKGKAAADNLFLSNKLKDSNSKLQSSQNKVKKLTAEKRALAKENIAYVDMLLDQSVRGLLKKK